MKSIEVKFKKLCPEAKLPERVHRNDVGMDMYTTRCEYDVETDTYIYYTGLACETVIDVDDRINVMFGFPRSSNSKTDCYLTNSVGIIDSDTYRGEIQARWKNRTSLDVMIKQEALRRFCMGKKNKYEDIERVVREEYLKRAHNLEFAPYPVGGKCFQIVLAYVPRVTVTEVNELSETERGTKGFGEAN